MNFLVVYNSALDAHSVSGVQRHFAGIVPQWIDAGHRVDFLVARAAWPVFRELYPRSALISPDNLFDPTGRLHQTWRFLPAFGWRMLTSHWVRLPVAYDLVYACAQHIYETYAARVIARRQHTRWGVKIHHVVGTQVARHGLTDRLYIATERLSTRWIHRGAHSVLCSTQPVWDDFASIQRSLGLQPRPASIVGYGIDLRSIPAGTVHAPEYAAVHLGRLHQLKGIFDIPAIWQRVVAARPEAKLLVLGDGPHRRELERRIGEAGLQDSVSVRGAVTDREKNELLPKCAIGLSLSREEGWGLAITEFMGFGMPVVAMQLPIFDHVFPGQLDRIALGDVAGAASRIVHWLDHPEEASEFGRAGRRFIERYDYVQVARDELAALTAGTPPAPAA